MDLYPLFNSIRIAFISTIIVFFIGIFSAYNTAKAPKIIKGILDVILTLPLVLPPTVVGYVLLMILGPNRIIGKFFLDNFNIRLTMTWWSAIFATAIIIYPLMYRTCRAAFEAYDEELSEAGIILNVPSIKNFWCIRIPNCKEGIIAGLVLSFARGLGEYGATSMIAGYTPLRTATISTTIYQLWRINDDQLALKWIFINLFISFIFLLTLNFVENKRIRNRAK